MKNKLYLVLLTFIIGSCGGTFPIHKYGANTDGHQVYVINVDSISRTKAENVAIAKANEHCSKLSLSMYPEKDRNNQDIIISRNQVHHIKLVFTCRK